MKLVALTVLLTAALAAQDTFLIRNADVYPVSGPKMEGVSILVEKGKIADIGPKVSAPRGVRVVEAKGQRVYPGIIDSGTALGLSEIAQERMTVDTGELGVFMPQLRALTSVNPASEHFPVARANGITSAVTFPSLGGGGGGGRGGQRQVIAGQASLLRTDGWTWEEMQLKGSVALHIIFPTLTLARPQNAEGAPAPPAPTGRGGADQATYAEGKRNYDRQMQELDDFFENARRYKNAKAAGGPGFKTDLKYEAMLPVLEGQLPVAVTAPRERAIRDAIAFAEKQKVRLIVLQPRELGKVATELKAKNIPLVLGRTLALPRTEDNPYDAAFTLPAEAYKAGLKFAFGTFENQFVRDLPYNAATAVAFGLPADEALKAITINAAEIWGVADQIGSIQKGKWADLMITDGDPLETPTEIKHLYIKGREADLSNKQTRLYERYLNRP